MIEHLLSYYLRTVLARSWNELMSATREPAAMQESRLLDIIARNTETRFGREHKFIKIRSVEDFRKRVPVRGYDEFEPYIDRMCAGEKTVLTTEEPLMFGRTSGTTGNPKLIPITPSYYEEFSKMQKMWQRKLVSDHRRMLRGKILSVMSPEVEGYTECGIPYGAMSGHSYRLQYPIAQSRYAVPYDIMCLKDFEAKYYLLLRLALERNVTAITAMNPSTILLLMKKLNLFSGDLARDIRDGTVNRRFDIPARLRRQVEEHLRPNPKRAARLEALAASGPFIRGTDVWKNLAIIVTWQGGSTGFFLREFPKYFAGIPVRDMGLIATEGYFSVPLESDSPNGLLAVTGHFFEFFPIDSDGGRSDTALGCEELERGGQYFIVPTTSAGLYRYDISDIVEVVDFHHKTPIIVFRQKGRDTVSIVGEKVTDVQVTEAVRAAASSPELALEGFVLALRLGDPPSYVLVAETTQPEARPGADLLRRFESELRFRNIEYASKRASQRLGDPTLWLVESGFFEARRKEFVSRGAPDGQYKMCHVTSDPGFLDRIRPTVEIPLPAETACDEGVRS